MSTFGWQKWRERWSMSSDRVSDRHLHCCVSSPYIPTSLRFNKIFIRTRLRSTIVLRSKHTRSLCSSAVCLPEQSMLTSAVHTTRIALERPQPSPLYVCRWKIWNPVAVQNCMLKLPPSHALPAERSLFNSPNHR